MSQSAGPSIRRTELVVITDNRAVADEVADSLAAQADARQVERATGIFGAAGAVRRDVPVVVLDADLDDGMEVWRLSALPGLQPSVAVVVVSRHPRRDTLAGQLRAHFVVDSQDELPPLRELVTGVTPTAAPSGSRRRDGSSHR